MSLRPISMFPLLMTAKLIGCRPPPASPATSESPVEGAAPTSALSRPSAQAEDGELAVVVSGTVPRPQMPPSLQRDPRALSHLLWETFIALNWPADLSRGRGVALRPEDPSVFGRNGVPLVWETWKQSWEAAQEGGLTEWDSYAVNEEPPCAALVARDGKRTEITRGNWPELYRSYGGTVLDKLNLVKTNPDESPTAIPFVYAGPLIDDNREYLRYEVRYNRELYDCVRDGTPEGCRKASSYISMPAADATRTGAISLKASWRKVMSEEDKKNYHHRDLLVVDYDALGKKVCHQQTMALVGMHLVYKDAYLGDPADAGAPGPEAENLWLWTSFEYKGNAAPCPEGCPSCSNGYSYEPALLGPAPLPPRDQRTPVKLCRITQIPGITASTNTLFQEALRAHSPWNQYEAVNAQWLIGGSPRPSTAVADVTLEPYSQSDTCMGCHDEQATATDRVWDLMIDRVTKAAQSQPPARPY